MANIKSKDSDMTIVALSEFIFRSAENSMVDFEQKEDLKEIAKEFNDQPFLKRFLDFSIIYFWATTISCELFYEHNDFLKISRGIDKNIDVKFSEIEKVRKNGDIVLKNYVLDKDELMLLYRNYPEVHIGEETAVNFNVLLDTLIPKRQSDYNSTLPLDSVWQLQKLSSYFCKHVFGRAEYESEKLENSLLHAAFSLHVSAFMSSCTKLITEIEKLESV